MYTHTKINIVCFLISCFISSVALADISFDEEEIQAKVQILKKEAYDKANRSKEECINIKKDPNHKLHKYSIYFNDIVNHILSKNKDKDILKNINPEDICILPNTEGGTETTFSDLTTINIKLLSLPTITNDAAIASVISHELVHSIFNHSENNNNIRLELHVKVKKLSEMRKQLQNEASYLKMLLKTITAQNKEEVIKRSESLSNNAKTLEKYEQQIQLEYTNYIKQVQESEIQADDEGFKLYLNAGFKPEIFRQSFFDVEPFELYPNFKFPPKKDSIVALSDDKYYLLKETFTLKGCIREGSKVANSMREPNKILDRSLFMESNFMNTIKYSHFLFFNQNTADVHPTRCWRFWNIQTQLWWKIDEESLNFRKQNMENLPDSQFNTLKESIKTL